MKNQKLIAEIIQPLTDREATQEKAKQTLDGKDHEKRISAQWAERKNYQACDHGQSCGDSYFSCLKQT